MCYGTYCRMSCVAVICNFNLPGAIAEYNIACTRVAPVSVARYSRTPTAFTVSQAELPWAACPADSNLTGRQQECEVSSPTQYFWYRETLNITSSMEEGGSLHRGQTVCLLMAWMVVYLCIVKGVKSTGKVLLL